MPRSTVCILNHANLPVQAAIEMRDQQRRVGGTSPDFRCSACGNPVRPHSEAPKMGAHFEHLHRNRDCPLGDGR